MKVKSGSLNSQGYYELSAVRKWIGLFLIALGGGTIYLVPYLLASYVNQIHKFTGIDLTQLNLLVTVYGVVSLIFYIPGGWIADRVSTKTLFTFSMLGTGGVSIWYSLLGVQGINIDYSQLVLIHACLAVTTVLTFWSAFVKGVKLMGSPAEQASLYSKCDVMRNIIGVIMTFVTTSVVGVVIAGSIFKTGTTPSGSGIFLLIFLYAAVYIITGILCLFFLPGELIQRSTKRNIQGLFEFRNSKGEIIIVQNKSDLKPCKLASRNYFWQKAWLDLKESVKSKSVWLVALLIFFTMNAYAVISMFGTIFSANYGINETTASYLANMYVYGTPIIGAMVAGIVANKKFKSSAKTLIYISIAMFVVSIGLFLVPTIGGSSKTLSAGIIGVLLISILMLFIGASRGIYWSTMTETKIPLSIAGLASGFISIVGFSKDIWVAPVLSEMIKPFAGTGSNVYSNSAFIALFAFLMVNCFLAIVIAYYLYKRSLIVYSSEELKGRSVIRELLPKFINKQ